MIKRSIFRSMGCLLLLSVGNADILAQGIPKPKDENQTLIEDVRNQELKKDENWKWIKLDSVTFYIPQVLHKKQENCIEGSCYTFRSEDLILKIDVNPDAWRPTFEKEFPSYEEEFVCISNRLAWLWHFEVDREYQYISGANFQVKKDSIYEIGMYLFSKAPDTEKTAERIFKSVEINSK